MVSIQILKTQSAATHHQILSGAGCCYNNMVPDAKFRPKYHNYSFMEKLFSGIRALSDTIVCGDLGNFTMDPYRTLQLCLCYGVSPAVAMGVAEAAKDQYRTVCITGDAAYLHSGQQCLYEMVERNVNVSVFVLENGGALGTGGQAIPGDLYNHPRGVRLFDIDYATATEEELRSFVFDLPTDGINLIIIHTHEEKH